MTERKKMPRKPSETVQVNLRMKEAMRRRLAQAAANRGISLNAEMMRRLEDSFDQESNRSLDQIAHDMRTSAESVVAATKMWQSAAKVSSEAMLQATAVFGRVAPESSGSPDRKNRRAANRGAHKI
jgi:hypothetical protein